MRTSLFNLEKSVERPLAASPVPAKPAQESPKSPAAAVRSTGSTTAAAAAPALAAWSIGVEEPKIAYEDPVEFELVFGRRQIASTGLVMVVVVACFSGISYLVGKSTGTKPAEPVESSAAYSRPVAAATALPVVSDPAKSIATSTFVPAVAKTESPKGEPSKADAPKDQAPLFSEATPGKIYMQVGAVEKGLAAIWAEGLRTHALPAFVSPGPNDKSWRVLIGPLSDPQAYQQAKATLDGLGISTFGRKYGDEPKAGSHAAPPQATQPPTP